MLPASARGLAAIVAGANGAPIRVWLLTETSGQHILRVLLSHPEVWATIYALSRKPAPAETSAAVPRVKHISTEGACYTHWRPEAIDARMLHPLASRSH